VITPTGTGYLRIGELARRLELTPDVLRAWERRYGIFDPHRSPGGFRLYSDLDLARAERMQALIADGLAPAQAALRARQESDGTAAELYNGDPIAQMRTGLESFDESLAHRALDHLIETFTLETLLSNVVFPYLRDLGARWRGGDVTIAQEHFASRILRARLMEIGRGWDGGSGPRVVLACPPGELHDLPLVCLGLALRDRDWRITLLGADTPVSTITDTVATISAYTAVVAITIGHSIMDSAAELTALAARVPLVLTGPGVTDTFSAHVGARLIAGDPIAVANHMTAQLTTARHSAA
jgi:DNA-binding transcriptional MerR regulator